MTLDLRAELIKILDGDEYNVGVSIPMIYRYLNPTSRCACNQADWGGRIDPKCKYCDNEGYLWTEYGIQGYMSQGAVTMKVGDINVPNIEKPVFLDQADSASVYLRWTLDFTPKDGDKLYRLRLNSDGSVYYRVDAEGNRYFERLEKYIVEDAVRIFGDSGNLIYYRLIVKKDLTWRKNSPAGKKY